MRHTRRVGFTLIEVLIVVVVMAILAATIIPQFSTSTHDAKEALLRHHLHTMRSQIELYKLQHGGLAPSGFSPHLQLTKATSATGAISPTGLPTPTHPLGPYLSEIPQQPFSGLTTVTVLGSSSNPSFIAAPGGGWIVQIGTGKVWVNHADYSTW